VKKEGIINMKIFNRGDRITKVVLLLLLAAFISDVAAEQNSGNEGSATLHKSIINGSERTYWVYQPQGKNGLLPLMIVLHGGFGNGKRAEASTRMDDVADSGPFIVAYPDGTGGAFERMRNRRTWNAGICCGRAARLNVDDVGFITTMVNEIEHQYPVDKNRIYVSGMSNGAMMAYRLACEIPDKIAAVIAVSGTLAIDHCAGADSVAVLHIHGDHDEHVPLAGGVGVKSRAGVAYRPVSDTLAIMKKTRACSAPQKKQLFDGIEEYTVTCNKGAPVDFIKILGGKHAWPGGHGRNNEPGEYHGFSASKEAWHFARQFSKTPLPNSDASKTPLS
jgi:polyhydroxybutyrate depolymerase